MASTQCAACRLQSRTCSKACLFAPHFPADQPHKFAFVHRVFGAHNVAKILQALPVDQRDAAASCLYYEAEARLRDPVYGCVGLISVLQQRLRKVRRDLVTAKNELARYAGTDESVTLELPSPGVPPPSYMSPPSSFMNDLMPSMGITPDVPQGETLVICEASQSRPHLIVYETSQRTGGAFLGRQEQETFRCYEINTAGGFNLMESYMVQQEEKEEEEPENASHTLGDQLQMQLVLDSAGLLDQPLVSEQEIQQQRQQPPPEIEEENPVNKEASG